MPVSLGLTLTCAVPVRGERVGGLAGGEVKDPPDDVTYCAGLIVRGIAPWVSCAAGPPRPKSTYCAAISQNLQLGSPDASTLPVSHPNSTVNPLLSAPPFTLLPARYFPSAV